MTCCSCCWTQTSARSKHCTKLTAIIWSGTCMDMGCLTPAIEHFPTKMLILRLMASRLCWTRCQQKEPDPHGSVVGDPWQQHATGYASGSQLCDSSRTKQCDMPKIVKLHKIVNCGGLRFILIYLVSCKQLSTFHERYIFFYLFPIGGLLSIYRLMISGWLHWITKRAWA